LQRDELVVNGILYWDVPNGNWRIFIFIRTRKGGEEWTKDYLNPIDPEAVKKFIEYVYEEHYKHYSKDFGKTIAGFFCDEPRFGNASTYEGTLGKIKMVLPFSNDLLEQLNKEFGSDFKLVLPCLWYDCGNKTSIARYTYMNVVSKLYSDNFSLQIGNWCKHHNVKFIGHVVEDNGAHTRLGYGSGHFFRSIKGQDYSGIDVVYQIWPEFFEGKFTTPFGYLDADFFYWGLAKMASSASHIDPNKNGVTACEIFGAYGWQEGLKLMKWLTDHVCVRGVNFLIPHAFSPKEYPDPDCPPHFYARGNNPQWKYFNIWSDYANRVCHLLNNGIHIASVAVVYHAEAEWAGGKYEPFEKVVKTLNIKQIDCDVIPIDVFYENTFSIKNGYFSINKENYKAVIVPYSEYLPYEFIKKLIELANSKIYVIFMNDFPRGTCEMKDEFPSMIELLKNHQYCIVSDHNELANKIIEFGFNDIEISSYEESLRFYHYVRGNDNIYFFTNESKYKSIDTIVKFKNIYKPIAYDAMENKLYKLNYKTNENSTSVKLHLDPYESIFIFVEYSKVIFSQFKHNINEKHIDNLENELIIDGKWEVSIADSKNYPNFVLESKIKKLGNISTPELLPNFSGTIRYEMSFEFNVNDVVYAKLNLGEVYEIADVELNGKHIGTKICPPYCFDVTNFLLQGENKLKIDVTNTLAKSVGNNDFDRAMAQEPSGLIGPITLLYKSL